MALCAFFTSFFQSFAAYVFLYGVLYGFLVGFCYLIPMLNCYAYLPHKKGIFLASIRIMLWSMHDGFWLGVIGLQLHFAWLNQPEQRETRLKAFVSKVRSR
jgi:hypothetical protein